MSRNDEVLGSIVYPAIEKFVWRKHSHGDDDLANLVILALMVLPGNTNSHIIHHPDKVTVGLMGAPKSDVDYNADSAGGKPIVGL